jgi:hypothetical protein
MSKIFVLIILILSIANLVSAQQPTPMPPNNGQPPSDPPNDINALANHQIFLAYSEDGLHWRTDNQLIRDSSSVPALFYWQESLWILAVNGTADENFEKLVMLHQQGDGTWEEWFIDLPFEGRPVDPDVVVLPDDTIRLYFFDFSVNAQPPSPNQSRTGRMYSATSEDGITFTLDEGVRLESTPPATDPDVIQQGDVWWMFVSHPQEGDMIVAQSEDGLTFSEVGMVTHGSIADTVLLEDGTLRQYACVMRGSMAIMESENGLDWTARTDIQPPPGCDPDVVQLPDGSWVMVYKTMRQTR